MAKHRTKKQKRTAQERRQTFAAPELPTNIRFSHKSDSDQTKLTVPAPVKKDVMSAIDFFGFETKLIYQDLLKTIAVTLVVLLALGVFVWWLR